METKPTSKNRRDETHQIIMEAALTEFSLNGFQGTRMDTIARRAGRNKALLYRYYTDKDGLFLAAMRYMFQEREKIRAQKPESLGDALAYWFQGTNRDPNFMRLIMQEALNHKEGTIPAEAAYREAYYQRQIQNLKDMQAAGSLPESLDPNYLFIALTSLISWPTAFPQIIQLICGKHPSDASFVSEYANFLKVFSHQLTQNEPKNP